jgi:hypothetical protein
VVGVVVVVVVVSVVSVVSDVIESSFCAGGNTGVLTGRKVAAMATKGSLVGRGDDAW